MNTKVILTVVSLCALAITGCVTIESTRTRLASSNPEEVEKAQKDIIDIAVYGRSPGISGNILSVKERLEYIDLVEDDGFRLRILERTLSEPRIAKEIIAKLDFTKPGLAMEIITNHPSLLEFNRTYSDFVRKVTSVLSEQELPLAFSAVSKDYGMKWAQELVVSNLLEKAQDPQVLVPIYQKAKNDSSFMGMDGARRIQNRLVDLVDRLTDQRTVLDLLKERDGNRLAITQPGTRAKLLSRLSDETAIKLVQEEIHKCSVWEWFDDAVFVTARIKDSPEAEKTLSSMFKEFASYEKVRGANWMDVEMRDRLNKFLKGLPWLDDSMMKSFICGDETSWQYFIDSIPENMAYDILVDGKAKSKALEHKLVDKLPVARLDMKVYNGVRFDETRKAVMAKMPPELKRVAAAEAEKVFRAICEKAKSAAKETFELDGFYLGMTFGDMKIVFAHHFPTLEIKEGIDGEGKDADHVIYVPGQSSPFCYASVSDKKVWLFNFGKKLLKKWYPFDVQTPAEWVAAYERATKVDMRFKLIEKDTTVYEPMDMSRSYRVWFHQESYQYRHNTKKYRLTYFGEQKDFTLEGGLGGAVIKEMAASSFRYVRGDPDSLRVQIERD